MFMIIAAFSYYVNRNYNIRVVFSGKQRSRPQQTGDKKAGAPDPVWYTGLCSSSFVHRCREVIF